MCKKVLTTAPEMDVFLVALNFLQCNGLSPLSQYQSQPPSALTLDTSLLSGLDVSLGKLMILL